MLLVAAVVLADTLFYAAIAPLLPELSRELMAWGSRPWPSEAPS